MITPDGYENTSYIVCRCVQKWSDGIAVLKIVLMCFTAPTHNPQTIFILIIFHIFFNVNSLENFHFFAKSFLLQCTQSQRFFCAVCPAGALFQIVEYELMINIFWFLIFSPHNSSHSRYSFTFLTLLRRNILAYPSKKSWKIMSDISF